MTGCTLLAFAALALSSPNCVAASQPAADQQLKQLSLAQLGDIEVTTINKEPEEVWDTPAAVTVMAQEEIRHSGATSIPELLRLANILQPHHQESTGNDANTVGIRHNFFGSVDWT